MSVSTSVSINGVSVPVKADFEVTSGAVFDIFSQNVNVLQNTLFQTSGAAAPPITSASLPAVQTAITNLLQLLLNGAQVPNIPGDPSSGTKVDYMSFDEVSALNNLFESLTASGATVTLTPTPSFTFPSLAVAQNWQNLVTSTAILQALFSGIASASAKEAATRSLQAMVELEYVRAGNELINDKMTDLQNQLTSTQSILDSLSALQNVHNQLVVNSPGSFTALTHFNWSGAPLKSGTGAQPAEYQSAYKTAASAFYGQPISPVISIPAGATIQVDPAIGDFFNYNDQSIVAGSQNARIVKNPDNPRQFLLEIWKFGSGIPPTLRDGTVTHFNLTQRSGTTNIIDSGGYMEVANTYVINDPYSIQSLNNVLPLVFGQLPFFGFQEFLPTADNAFITVPNGPLNDGQRQTIAQIQAIMQPTAIYGPPMDDLVRKLVAIRDGIANEIQSLLARNGSNPVDPTSLLAKLQQVQSDLTTTFVTNTGGQPNAGTTALSCYNGFAAWMLDKYNLRTSATNANQSGLLQQNIIFAITAAQSTNDQQAEKVRQFLYVFEQFYQSASSILQSITQILTRMAQGIAR